MEKERAAGFVQARKQCGVNPLLIHAIYLINLASDNPALANRSKGALRATMQVGSVLESFGVVTHLGSHAGRGFAAVAPQIAAYLLQVLDGTPRQVRLILENSAGAGSLVGAELAELGELLDRAGRHPRLLVALDTAHLCGAGWDFRERDTAERLVGEVDRCIGLDRLAVVHANDSAAPCGSRKDRHANIGEGHVGFDGFRNLLAQPALRQVPWILETPNLEQRIDDRANLQALAVQPFHAETRHAS
jgi:deoxyribonuclease-4